MKYLLAIIVILGLVVLGLRVCEGAGYISLDSVRSMLGNSTLVNAVFPAPAAETGSDDPLSPTPMPMATDSSADAAEATAGTDATSAPNA